MLQNAQMALDFLRYKKIKLVNIRAEDIVDGNPKLTLGLIWTIILHFQVSLENIIISWSPIYKKMSLRRISIRILLADRLSKLLDTKMKNYTNITLITSP